MNATIAYWRNLPNARILIKYFLDTLIYSDNQVLLANSENNVQLSVHNLNKIVHNYKIKMYLFYGKITTNAVKCF